LTNNCQTGHIPAIDSMRTSCWKPPWILRPKA